MAQFATASCPWCSYNATGVGETKAEAQQDASRQVAGHMMDCPNDPNK